MIPKLIKTEKEYEAALLHVDSLMSAAAGTPEMEELELWVHLVEKYEDDAYPISPPNPLAAIRFKMEQLGLHASDLVPCIGSKSKVSEVLAGKRGLSLAMIRKLHDRLGIPAEILKQDAGLEPSAQFDHIDWRQLPLAEIAKRRWFGDAVTSSRRLLEQAEELVGALFKSFEVSCPGPVALRQSAAQRAGNQEVLKLWEARVLQLGLQEQSDPLDYEAIDREFVSQIAHLSVLDAGPVVAREVLSKAGIRLVIERQLPGTRLDGAVMKCAYCRAIIGFTLRYDRLDYFWFTLCHELAHLALHMREGDSLVIVDDLESEERTQMEREADELASDALISPADWSAFFGSTHISELDITGFARRQRIHPSVVAGRMRRESGDYSRFNSLLGHRKVRSLFVSVNPG